MSELASFSMDRPFVSPEALDAFCAVMDRLDIVIEAETRALSSHNHSGLFETLKQKRQGLLELNRIMQALQGTIPSQMILERLGLFRRRLVANNAALTVELSAAKAVTDTIVRVMRETESDGTYSRSHARFGYDDL